MSTAKMTWQTIPEMAARSKSARGNVLLRTYLEVRKRLGEIPVPIGDGFPEKPEPFGWAGPSEWSTRFSDDPRQILRPIIPGSLPIRPEVPKGITYVLPGHDLESVIKKIGMEAIAFYKSFRLQGVEPYKGYWGIFYLESGLQHVQQQLEKLGLPHAEWNALELVRRHECFHFKFDVYALGIESATSKHLYLPLKSAFHRRGDSQIEEALANHEAWQWASKQGPALKQFVYDFMSNQPGAYARFAESRETLAGELASSLIDQDLRTGARRDDQVLWVGNLPTAMARWQSYCPQFLVADKTWKLDAPLPPGVYTDRSE